MKKLSLVATLALTLMGCQPDPQQGKIDQLAKDVAEIKQLLKSGAGAGAATGAAGAAGADAAARAAAAAKPQPPRRVADPSKAYAFNIEGLPSVGPADAKVTVVKAYEYMCPYCEKVNPTIEQLKAKYGKDIRFVYSQRIIHPAPATPPSLAACAANKQGKFSEMDKKLWEAFNARTLSEAIPDPNYKAPPPVPGQKPKPAPQVSCHTQPGGCPKLDAMAQAIGLDMGKYKTDFKACEQEIQAQMAHSTLMGAGGTPGFFVNGRFLNGAQPLERFVAVIDEEIKKADERIAQGTKPADYYKTWVLEKGEKEAPFNKPTP